MNSIFLHNKIAVISGATGYVGSHVAMTLSRAGMRVALLTRDISKDTAKNLLSELSGSGHKVYVCDVSNSESVSKTLDMIEDELGPIYAAIHAAGTKPTRKKLYLTSEKEMKDQIDTTIIGGFNFLTWCAKKLKNNNTGVLIGLTTAGVIIPEASQSLGAYIPAKYAIQGMLVMLREEMAEYNVHVHSIAPGFMPGGMNSGIPNAFVEMIKTKSKTHELMDAEKIAECVLTICTDDQRYLETGTIVLAPEYE